MTMHLRITLLAALAFVAQWSLLFIDDAHADSLAILGGAAIANSLQDGHSRAWAVEQEHGAWRVGLLNEGRIEGRKRDGAYVQRAWFADLTPQLRTEVLAGPYLTASTLPTDPTHYRDEWRPLLLAGVGLDWRAHEHWHFLLRLQRVVSFSNMDADILLLGVKWGF